MIRNVFIGIFVWAFLAPQAQAVEERIWYVTQPMISQEDARTMPYADPLVSEPYTIPAPDEHPWVRANPADPRNGGNLGPAGSSAPQGIEASGPAGTPGERVPSHEGPRGRPGDFGKSS